MPKMKDGITISTTLGVIGALAGSAAPALADPPVYSLIQVQLPSGVTVAGRINGGLNNQGDIAFTAISPGSNANRGFIWRYASRRAFQLGTLGGNSSGATAINDCGDAVGSAALKGDKLQHATLFRRGSVIDLDPHGSRYSFAMGINNRGTVVGRRDVGDDGPHPVIFENGTVRDLTGQSGQAVSINLSGEIAGSSITGSNAFVIKDGKVTNFTHTQSASTQASAINDYGDVLGVAELGASSATSSFIFQDGQIFDLPLIDFGQARNQDAMAFNNAGEIVGVDSPQIPILPSHAFLIRGQIVYTLNDLVDPADPLAKVVNLSDAFAINDSGWIASLGIDSRDNLTHVYLLKRQTPAIRLQRVKGSCPVADVDD